jgi:hypothetical protein
MATLGFRRPADRLHGLEGGPPVTSLSGGFIPAPAPGVESCELDGERLVWRGASLHRLDAVGAAVWECFDGDTPVTEIARTLAEVFRAAEETVRRDVSALCTALFDEGLLDGADPKSPYLIPPLRPGHPPSRALSDSIDLPHVSGRFLAVHYDFGIRTNDARLASYFDRSLRSFAAGGTPSRWYSVVVDSRSTEERYRIYLDDEGLLAAPDAEVVARYVVWHVNHALIRASSDHVLVHAAGATSGGRALALPGEMNAGKTTLVAGLVMAGFGFLTDEIVALNMDTGLIDPYPRPLNIGSGSWEVLAELRPADRDEAEPIPRDMWHVDPSTIRPDAVAESAPLGFVMAPRFEKGTITRLEPLSRPEAVELLHRNTFNRHRLGSAGIRALISAVRQAQCSRLISGDLASAVATVRRFVE